VTAPNRARIFQFAPKTTSSPHAIARPTTRSSFSPTKFLLLIAGTIKKYSNSQISFSGSDSFALHIIAIDGNASCAPRDKPFQLTATQNK
jgi:hypothetical protein